MGKQRPVGEKRLILDCIWLENFILICKVSSEFLQLLGMHTFSPFFKTSITSTMSLKCFFWAGWITTSKFLLRSLLRNLEVEILLIEIRIFETLQTEYFETFFLNLAKLGYFLETLGLYKSVMSLKVMLQI